MAWPREDEFRRLLSGATKQMTKDGLDKLVAIGVKDMLQCYKAVPALCVHTIKKAPSNGPGRLHVLRTLDAIVGGSLNKNGSNDKYVARIEAARTLQPMFEALGACGDEYKAKAHKVLMAWQRHNVFSPAQLTACITSLGYSPASASPAVTPPVTREAAPEAAAAAARPRSPASQPSAPAIAAPSGALYKRDPSPGGAHGTSRDVEAPLSDSDDLFPQGRQRSGGAAAALRRHGGGAPPLPPGLAGTSDAALDSIALPAGAALVAGGAKRARRSKFDQPASSSVSDAAPNTAASERIASPPPAPVPAAAPARPIVSFSLGGGGPTAGAQSGATAAASDAARESSVQGSLARLRERLAQQNASSSNHGGAAFVPSPQKPEAAPAVAASNGFADVPPAPVSIPGLPGYSPELAARGDAAAQPAPEPAAPPPPPPPPPAAPTPASQPPSLHGPSSIEVQPPPSFGEVWTPAATAAPPQAPAAPAPPAPQSARPPPQLPPSHPRAPMPPPAAPPHWGPPPQRPPAIPPPRPPPSRPPPPAPGHSGGSGAEPSDPVARAIAIARSYASGAKPPQATGGPPGFPPPPPAGFEGPMSAPQRPGIEQHRISDGAPGPNTSSEGSGARSDANPFARFRGPNSVLPDDRNGAASQPPPTAGAGAGDGGAVDGQAGGKRRRSRWDTDAA